MSSSTAPALRGKKKKNNSPENEMIIAVDFGTTYSGVAFATTGEPDKQTLLRNWGRGVPNQEKVPTILRYDNGGRTGPFKWGYQARKNLPMGEKIHEWFKLGLCPEYEERRRAESELSRKYPSTTALYPVKGKDAEKLVVDYLSGLNERVEDHFQGFDAQVRELPRKYVVTVPAIWDYKEQQRTRSCAERAGMGKGNRLQVISEPEAAAIYALDRRFQIGLAVGNTFIICDAGGGTVDLTSYTIQSLDPICLDGAGKGSGGLCGSSFLNRIFTNYLQRKLRNYYGGWGQALLNYAVDEFEKRIKAEFTGDDDDTYTIVVNGLSDSPEHGIVGGILELGGRELRENVFNEVITKIQGLVRDQIENTSGEIKAVLLAGGFGQSAYLKQQLELVPSVIERKIVIEQIENSNTAIVRGALIAGLTQYGKDKDEDGVFKVRAPRVNSRIAGKFYGTRAYQLFHPNEDDSRRRKRQATGEYLVERMQWFINEGDSIRDGVPKSFYFEKEREVSYGQIQEVTIRIYTYERRDANGLIDVKYPDDPGVRECANFKMDLRGLDVPIERRYGIDLYVAKIDIEMTLESASLSFCVVYGKGTSNERRFEPKFVQFV